MGKIVLKSFRGLEHQVQASPYYDGHVQLGVQLNSAGFERCPSDYSWDGLKRGDKGTVLLQYTVAGTGALRYEQTHYDIMPGQMMLVVIPHDHHYWLPDDQDWEHCYMTCSGDECIRLAQALIKQHGPVFSLNPEAPCVTHFSQLVRSCLKKQLQSARQASHLLYGVFMDLLSVREHLDISPDAQALQDALKFVQAHLDEDIGVHELAQAAGMSRYHFSRIFKQHIGVSPGLWINQQRVHEACSLLLDGTMSMQEISKQCGFSDVNYFGKVFKRIQGMSPGQFRDSGLFG